jgi:cystathionine beta-lyase
MPFDFDTPIPRGRTESSKWTTYPPDVLPLWVADMDFAVAPAIQEALRRRIDHAIYGYSLPPDALREQIVAEMRERYGWTVAPEAIVFLPGVEAGFNMALKATSAPGDAATVFLPVYRPLHLAPGHWQVRKLDVVLRPDATGAYVADLDAAKSAFAQSKTFLFCNPHNPVGKVFKRPEIEALAQACLSSGTVIVSDEVHCDLLFDGRRHIPTASLAPEVAARTITLMSASKTYNIPGLKVAFAIIPDTGLRQRFNGARLGLVGSINPLGLEATRAAYAEGAPWRQALLAYLQANRDYLARAVATRLPGITMNHPEGTYLAWLDCSKCDLGEAPFDFFLKRAKVALNAGIDFGEPGRDFVRLNFGCPRATLENAIARMERALAQRNSRAASA